MTITTGYKKAIKAAMEHVGKSDEERLKMYDGVDDWFSFEINIYKHPTKRLYAVTYESRSYAIYAMNGGQ